MNWLLRSALRIAAAIVAILVVAHISRALGASEFIAGLWSGAVATALVALLNNVMERGRDDSPR